MTQLSINGIDLPETKNGKYKCYEQELGESIRMISGRLVTEVRSSVHVIEYSYDYMGNAVFVFFCSAKIMQIKCRTSIPT